MNLPRVIEGKRILLVQMPEQFIKDTWQTGKAATEDFLSHPDWFKEKELARLRYEQMQGNRDVGSWLLRAIVDKSDGKMIGHFNCHDLPNSDFLRKYHVDAIEFGYAIYQPYRKQGYAKEAVETMIDYLKKFRLAQAVVLSAATTNIASLVMIKSLGFKEIDMVRTGEETEKVFMLKI